MSIPAMQHRQVPAAAQSAVTIYEVLKRDHQIIRSLLDEINALGISQPSHRMTKFLELKKFLTAHSKAEEKVFYRPLEDFSFTSAIARESEVEHSISEALMETILELKPDDPYWNANFSVLKIAVEKHIRKEESELFLDAYTVLTDDQALLMAVQMEHGRFRLLAKLS